MADQPEATDDRRSERAFAGAVPRRSPRTRTGPRRSDDEAAGFPGGRAVGGHRWIQDKPADSFPSQPWPLLAAVAVFTVGLGMSIAGRWRRGCVVMAAGMGLAALLRLLLPAMTAGLLVVRRRWIDVLVLLGLGGIIAALAWIVPPGRS